LSRLRIFVALMLAVTALQAVPARPLPLHPDNGPAFSASSAEVALPARRPLATEQKVTPPHPPLTGDTVKPIPLVTDEGGVEAEWPTPYRVRAPPQRVLTPAAPPRGPPLS
jgi:hypothetical protein